MKNDYVLYIHTNLINGKRYVGITDNPKRRFGLNGNGYKYSNPVFYKAIQKYGWNNFSHEIRLTNLTLKEAHDRERFYISLFRSYGENGYNLTYGGEGSPKGAQSKEEKKKKNAVYYNKNKEKQSIQHKIRYGENKDEILKKQHKRYWEKRDEILADQRERYTADPRTDYHKAYYQAHKEDFKKRYEKYKGQRKSQL